MNQDARIDQLLALVLELANGNLDARLEATSRSEPLDGVIEGLNMLAEELCASTAALKRSEESFRSLIERSPDAIFVHRDGKFAYVNAAALALLGQAEPLALIGSAIPRLFALEPALSPHEQPAELEQARAATPREGQLIHRSGAKVDVEVACIPVNFDGQAATLAIARDISARKQLTAKMMEMDRMIAVGTLAAGVGHEINNPLAYIVNNLDFALEALRAPALQPPGAPAADAALRQALLEAREGAERVRQIVRDLRTFSSTPATTRSTFALEPVLESAIHMAFNEIRHRAQLVREYTELPPVSGYSSRLGQVFLNLLVNAAHAIPVGSANEHHITVRTSCARGLVAIEISDTGVGIEPEHQARLFDPFFTTKAPGQGTGLGLFICQRIVREHQGELEVQSRPGQGSTFRVLLPGVAPERHDRQRPEPKKPSAALRARILVVDDEPGIGRSLARSLGRDHDVATVTCARDALRRLLEGDAYDVVLCDVMMPEMTGVELYAELERCRPDLAKRVLFFTGGAFTAATQAFVQRMGERCLEKPFDVREIRCKVAELCAELRFLPARQSVSVR